MAPNTVSTFLRCLIFVHGAGALGEISGRASCTPQNPLEPVAPAVCNGLEADQRFAKQHDIAPKPPIKSG